MAMFAFTKKRSLPARELYVCLFAKKQFWSKGFVPKENGHCDKLDYLKGRQ